MAFAGDASGGPGLRVSFAPEVFRAVLGEFDANARLIEEAFGVNLVGREGTVEVFGPLEAAEACTRFLYQLDELAQSGYRLRQADVALAVRLVREEPERSLTQHFLKSGIKGPGRRAVLPRTVHQRHYLESIRINELVFAIGPAGTGKTYLAVAMAVEALASRQVRRLVLCRPAVEAGERLGFLPGDLTAKVDPYLRPLYDALFDIWDAERVRKMIEQGVVEIAPLAFMRGRTLNDSFIILDEGQNTTSEQMKMFLTRIGEGSRAVVTGDVTQIDLPPGKVSGLVQAEQIVRGIAGIGVIRFDREDVVRHELVQRIVHAYEIHENRERGRRNGDADSRSAAAAEGGPTGGGDHR